ncbi:MAG: hypothetical protein COB46_04130 [Rhodospirillaceae bacterium]|nr:MAG: hypothetical protein COB46_04130 [Rhodospirillaceae bacterium]
MKIAFTIAMSVCLWSLTSGATEISPPLSKLIKFQGDEQRAWVDKDLARHLYLEKSTIKQVGGNTFNGCDTANIDKHKQIQNKQIPVTQYKGIPIIASPYYSVWVKVNDNNNKMYLDRFISALKVIENDTPELFLQMRQLMSDKGGYFIVGNFCPKNGGLTLGAFAPLPGRKQFVVMVSSTLLLMEDLFNPYDIAATLVHEAIGHGTAYYEDGSLSEFPAFSAQADFAAIVGDAQFNDVNNRSSNIRHKMKLSLSNAGHYLDKPD